MGRVGKFNIKYKLPKNLLIVNYYFSRFVFGVIGFYISYFIIYQQCLMEPDCNSVAVAFFSLLALACFEFAGFSIEKITNLTLT